MALMSPKVIFYIVCLSAFAFVGGLYTMWTGALWLLPLPLTLVGLGAYDMLQTRHAIRRNFPVAGRLRYLFEAIRPEMQQYFVESNTSGRPFSRQQRSLVYQRAKNVTDTLPFGTEEDVYAVGYEWMNHSLCALHPPRSARPRRRARLQATVRRRGAQRLGHELRRAEQERHLGAQSRRQAGRLLCPTGVATQDPALVRGLVVSDKAVRVRNYQHNTVRALVELLAASGMSSPAELRPWHILRRVSPTEVHHYGEMYEYLKDGALLSQPVPKSFARAWHAAQASSFQSAGE